MLPANDHGALPGWGFCGACADYHRDDDPSCFLNHTPAPEAGHRWDQAYAAEHDRPGSDPAAGNVL